MSAKAGTDPDPSSNPVGARERPEPGADPRRARQLKALRERLALLRDSLLAVREGTRQLTEIEVQRRRGRESTAVPLEGAAEAIAAFIRAHCRLEAAHGAVER